MPILDPYGRTVKVSQLTKPVATPGVTGVRSPFSNSIASGLTPQRLASILRNCDDGEMEDFLILAEEMEERDPHYYSVLGTRKRAMSGLTPDVIPAGEDAASVKIADSVEEQIAKHDDFPDLVESLMDAIGKGFAVVELDWKRTASQWGFNTFEYRDPRWFRFDRETGRELRMLDDSAPTDGLELTPYRFACHRAKLKSGLACRGGLARVAAFSWMCKAYTMKDWMAFIELYGLPIRIGRYDAAATKQDVEVLFRAVANIGTDAAAVIPKTMDIDFEGAGGGTASNANFENFARWADEQVSKAVLGQTMTADDGSSQSQAQVHDDVRLAIARADARAINGTITRDIVRAFVDLNFGPQKGYPKILLEVPEPEDIDLQLRHAARFAALGVGFKHSEIRRKAGFSEPDKDDEVTQPPQRQPALNTARNSAEPSPFDDLEEIEVDLLGDWEDVMEDLLDPFEDLIAGADSFEDALAKLETAAPTLGGSKLIEALVKGAFKARATGDVKDG